MTEYETMELVPPHSTEAEQALLGAIFLDNDMMHSVHSIVPSPSLFYRSAHGHIYEAMLALYMADKDIDWITVADVLSKTGVLDGAGGQNYLEEISVGTPAPLGAKQYAAIVRDKAILRDVISTTTLVRARAYSPTVTADDLREALRASVDRIDGITTKQIPDMQSVFDQVQAGVDDALENRALPGWDIGHKLLNDKMLGWQRGGVTAIASPPGGGKSFSAFSLCRLFQDFNEGERAAFLSLEMRAEELVERQIVHDRYYSDAVVGAATPEQKAAVDRRIAEARERPIQVIKPVKKDVDSILALIRSLAQRGFNFIVIDYIGLVRLGKGREHEKAMNDIPRLKDLADRCGIHILILSQMNKEGLRKSLTQFELVDLTGSRGSAIGNDAHSVMILFRLVSQRKDPVIQKVLNGLRLATVPAERAFMEGGASFEETRLFPDDEIERIVFQKTVKGRRGVPTFAAYWRTDDDMILRPLLDPEKVKVLNRLIG